jgi:hypothetical protein
MKVFLIVAIIWWVIEGTLALYIASSKVPIIQLSYKQYGADAVLKAALVLWAVILLLSR